MTAPILILGGTTEASNLARLVAEAGWDATVSLAGRVRAPAAQALPARIGGFGGVDGLVDYLRQHQIARVVDATHPFAAQISTNAVAACKIAGVPLLALTRAPWRRQTGDQWKRVPSIADAVNALTGEPRRVFLAVGRQHLSDFAVAPQHHYLLRVVDGLDTPPFPDCTVITDRGPFLQAADTALLQHHRIDLIVSKNAGGSGAEAKIIAARTLGLPVVMIDRPAMPARQETHLVDEVMRWLSHAVADRGV